MNAPDGHVPMVPYAYSTRSQNTDTDWDAFPNCINSTS